MKGWKIIEPFTLKEEEIADSTENGSMTKVKITKSLITLSDVLTYRDDIDCGNPILGSAGIGVVSETETNLFGLEKGMHVYVEPYKECQECYSCLSGMPSNCIDLLKAGVDFDGFLSDFVNVSPEKLFILPDSVPDLEALFIDHISLAIKVVDQLQIQKGDYV